MERIASLETKLDMLIRTVDRMVDKVDNTLSSLSENYVPKDQYNVAIQDLKERLAKLESAPRAWGPIIVAAISLLLQLMR